ncbi:HNH endonuclease [Enterovibrio norvegicus]|uniref:HNH endonuclease n=1 Tax=Enterovibrio norvegicus TaxID=188144 RepID=UPI0024119842|nr:HNH endonuclease [Enterovibrio norvegicus]MCC4798662.1 HNH endonuclease [Enterovibrio norvegicus]
MCPYCRQELKTTHGRHWDIEHVIPRVTVSNFMFDGYNLCVACVDCNGEKSDKKVTNSTAKQHYPKNPQSFLFVHPILDDYDKYIIVIEKGLFYYPLEEKGKNTIEICGLNRFYQYAGYTYQMDVFERIQMLTNHAQTVTCSKTQTQLLEEIAALSLRSIVSKKKTA